MHSFTFNGHNSEEFGIRIERFPDLNRSARKFKSASVSGRNGNIYQMEDAWEEVTVSYQIFAGDREDGEAVISFTDIMEWLHSADDYAELTDTYDPSHYRLAVYVDAIDIESEWHRFGKATIKFRCRPERYLVMSELAVENGDVINNPTNHIAKPIITLTGSGARSLLELTGKTQYSTSKPEFHTGELSFIVPTKDTQYAIVYRPKVGINVSGTSKVTNVSVSNDGSTLSFNVTSGADGTDYGVGFVVSVEPNASYTLSAEALGYGLMEVVFAQASGYNQITGSVNTTVTASSITSWKYFDLTFKTPSDCGYILVIFTRPMPVGAFNCQYKNIMLNKGGTALPYRAYADSSPSTLKVGDTILTIDGTFNTTEIDCERENVALDGVDFNNAVTVLDEYGNPSVDFLQLEKGDSQITYDGEITAMTIQPKMWEL